MLEEEDRILFSVAWMQYHDPKILSLSLSVTQFLSPSLPLFLFLSDISSRLVSYSHNK